MFGSWLAYITYIDHYRLTDDETTVRSTFCTGPAIRNIKNNFFSETIGTFILVFGALFIVTPNIKINGTEVENFGLGALDALPIGILVWLIGMALGGTTGYAINPARDFGPRIVYQLIPRKIKMLIGIIVGFLFLVLFWRAIGNNLQFWIAILFFCYVRVSFKNLKDIKKPVPEDFLNKLQKIKFEATQLIKDLFKDSLLLQMKLTSSN